MKYDWQGSLVDTWSTLSAKGGPAPGTTELYVSAVLAHSEDLYSR